MKKIVYIISLVLLLTTFGYANGDIKSSMDTKIHKALNILKEKNISDKQKAEKIFKMFDKMFDYNLMARLSIGRDEWYSITNEQKKSYIRAFEKLLKESFIEKLKLYNNQDIVVKDFLKTKRGRGILKTLIVGKKDSIKVDYKFYRSKKRGWIIYDVLISDVSIIQSYRKQFADILQNSNFDKFLKKIETPQKTNA